VRNRAPEVWCCAPSRNDEEAMAAEAERLRHHQHVENDDRRHGQQYRPDADGPQNVFGGKTLLFRQSIIFNFHDAPPRFLDVVTTMIDGRF
jgi:hypothetical protein